MLEISEERLKELLRAEIEYEQLAGELNDDFIPTEEDIEDRLQIFKETGE